MSWCVIGRNGIVTKQQGQSGNYWQVLFRLSALRKTPLYKYRYNYVHWKWAEIFPMGWNSGAILQKQLSLLAPQHQEHLAGRDIWAPAREILYWWCKICPESGQEPWLVDVFNSYTLYCFSYCFWTTVKRQRSNVNVMNLLQISQNVHGIYSSFEVV